MGAGICRHPCGAFVHKYVYARGVCELSMVEQRFVLCSEGVLQRLQKGFEICKRAVLCMLHEVVPVVEIRSEFERVWGA